MSSDAGAHRADAAAAAPDTVIRPLPAPLRGQARVPGDKSLSHRAVLFAAMAEGTSRLSGVLDSADVRSSIAAARALGATCRLERQPDGSLAGTVRGWGAAGPAQPAEPIDCGNSGTTVRLLMGMLAPWGIRVGLTGDASLRRRPMGRIAEPLALMGARFDPQQVGTLPFASLGAAPAAPDGSAPAVSAASASSASGASRPALKAVSYRMPVASAQMKTAILLAGVFAEGVTEVFEPAPSRNHTELMLPAFGVDVEARERYAAVRGGQRMRAADVHVAGDPSSAAFLACAATLRPGSRIRIEGVDLSPARIGFVRVLERMGADVRAENEASPGLEPCGAIEAAHREGLRGCVIEPGEIASLVDEIPVLALVAAHAQGVTRFREAGELRVKETDRFAAVVEGLGKLGVRAWGEGDDLCIEGRAGLQVPRGLAFDSLGDHRLAMTWALVGLCGRAPVCVRDFEAVRVSYPGFLEDMERLAR